MEIAPQLPHQSFTEWLLMPVGMTLSVFDTPDGSYYPRITDLWISVPIAIFLTLLRKFVVESIIARRIGQWLGMRKSEQRQASLRHRDVLDPVFRQSPREVPKALIPSLSSKTNLNERELHLWWGRRQRLGKPSTLTKFEESFWRALFYCSSFTYGCYVCFGSAYYWDTELFWIKNPMHHVPIIVYWYYVVELALYLSLIVSQFFDVRRKDFWQMFIHHVVTIALIVMSWWANMVRIGTMVLLYHDVADIFLEVAKLCKYAKYNKLADLFFVLFAIIFIISRLGFYAFHVVYSTYSEAYEFMDPRFPAAQSFRALLLALLLLHGIWTYTILRMAVLMMRKGSVGEDMRSDVDSAAEAEDTDGKSSKDSKAHKE